MEKANNNEVILDEIIKRIREEVSRKTIKSKGACENNIESTTKAVNDNLILLKFEDKKKNIDSKKIKSKFVLSDFLQYHDAQFVKHAYRMILKREADHQGYEHFLTQLRNGSLNKIEIIGRLRYSEEGRKKNVKIKGLMAPFLFNVAFKVPLVGYPLKLSSSLIRLPRILRNLQEFESFTNAQFTLRTEAADKSLENMQQMIDELRVNKADGKTVDELNNEISRVDSIKADNNTVKELLHAIQEIKTIKADAEAVDKTYNELVSSISTKANRDAVEALQKQVQDVEAGKADRVVVENLQKELLSMWSEKADKTTILELQEHLSKLDRAKAETLSIDEINEQLMALEKSKTDNALIEDIIDELWSLRTVKEDKKTVNALNNTIVQLQLSKAEAGVIDELNEQLRVAEEQIRAGESALAVLREKLGAVEAGKAERRVVDEVREAVAYMAASKAEAGVIDELNEQLRLAEEQIKAGVSAVEELREKLGAVEAGKADKQTTNIINNEIKDILRQTKDHKLNILDQHRRLALLLEEARKRLPKPISRNQIKNMLKEEDHLNDALYVSFEDQFRGTRDDIKSRQRVYLPYIEKAIAGTKNLSILDIGCGRGEWLEMLKENGYKGIGVDINNVMVQQCKEMGLDVYESDASEYLKKQKAGSFAAITGFHILEHMSLKTIIALFDEALRILQPGGMVIFETPNPENLIVGSNTFYTDPTHQRPIPSKTLQYLIESRGFTNSAILKLHKKEGQKLDNELLQNLFFGEQDYAVISYKS